MTDSNLVSQLLAHWVERLERARGRSAFVFGTTKLDLYDASPCAGLVGILESILTNLFSDPSEDAASWRAKLQASLRFGLGVYPRPSAFKP